MKLIFVISVRDKDGYYIPVVAADSDMTGYKAFREWCNEQEGNDYWDFSVSTLDQWIPYYKEGT